MPVDDLILKHRNTETLKKFEQVMKNLSILEYGLASPVFDDPCYEDSTVEEISSIVLSLKSESNIENTKLSILDSLSYCRNSF